MGPPSPPTIPDPEASGGRVLVLTSGERRLYLYAGRSFTLGRDARERGTDICLRLLPSRRHRDANRRISGRHLQLAVQDGRWCASDLHSTCGSTLDDQVLTPGRHRPLDGEHLLCVAGVLSLRLRTRDGALWIDRIDNEPRERYLLLAENAAVTPGADGLLEIGDRDTLRHTGDGVAWSDGNDLAPGPCQLCQGATWRHLNTEDQK